MARARPGTHPGYRGNESLASNTSDARERLFDLERLDNRTALVPAIRRIDACGGRLKPGLIPEKKRLIL